MKKQLIQFNFPGMTERQYDQVWDEIRRAGHPSPAGLVHHICSFRDNNCLIFDVWESREAFDRFGKVLMPILYKLGVDEVNPKITPVHYEISGVDATVSH
ncbi:MAG TPA: hypothetical protein DCL77_20365 [Prolixibacteraceae bacterium]|jgi:hypothetical protein|nr:hypothetical protein [Prolixibacteraceae bacterium]